jgi:hypothetical protein
VCIPLKLQLNSFSNAFFLSSTYREEFIGPIPEPERDDLISAYHKRLNSDDEATRVAAAKNWVKWE